MSKKLTFFSIEPGDIILFKNGKTRTALSEGSSMCVRFDKIAGKGQTVYTYSDVYKDIVAIFKTKKLNTNKKIYSCSKCGKLFNWDKNSSWYGSIKLMDQDTSKLIYACADECKTKEEK